jgi:hypothetical protein
VNCHKVVSAAVTSLARQRSATIASADASSVDHANVLPSPPVHTSWTRPTSGAGMPGQRPSALPLTEVPAVLLSSLGSARIDAHHSDVIRQHAERLARRLSAMAPMDRAVIHGDFTNDNVIASGTPPAATGVVDFALAHVEHPLADIATRCGAAAARPSTPPASTLAGSAASCTATTASGRCQPTRQLPSLAA